MLSLGLILLASCKTMDSLAIENKVSPTVESRGATFCEVSEPIYWSKKDTTETVVQIKKHNQTGVLLNCPGWVQGASPKVP